MRPIKFRRIQITASATDETTSGITDRNIAVKIDPTSAGINQLQFEAKVVKQSDHDRDENYDSNEMHKDLESKNQMWQPDRDGEKTMPQIKKMRVWRMKI